MGDSGTRQQVPMPLDWDDAPGWDRYYESLRDSGAYLDKMEVSFTMGDGARFAEPFKKAGWLKIWIPGCGASVLPKHFANHGFRVWASDVSSVAMQIQEPIDAMPAADFAALTKSTDAPAEPDPQGELHLLTHDFRSAFPESGFDCILNVRAFQALNGESLLRAACTHFEALRPGGYAFFSTSNVQGERRNWLEDALIEAGFYIPLNLSERWFRGKLAETGIPHIFILGRPMAFRGDEHYHGDDGQSRWEADNQLMRSFIDEYRQRQIQENEESASIFSDGVTRIAQVIYNTG